MSHKVTVEHVVDHLSELLDRVHNGHETFVIVVNGEEVGQLAPVPDTQPVATLGSFFELLKNNRPDSEYARDLEEIQADQQPIGNDPWAS